MPLTGLVAEALDRLQEGELVLVVSNGDPEGYPFNQEALDEGRLAFHWTHRVTNGPRVFIVRYGDF